MYEIIYVSAASKPFTAPEIEEILNRARGKNHEVGISGILLCHRGSFLQVLEGPDEQTVSTVFARIKEDSRHCKVLVLKRGAIPQRRFGDWRMAYVNVGDVTIGGDPVVARFMSGGPISELDPNSEEDLGRAGQLLDAFRDGKFRQH